MSYSVKHLGDIADIYSGYQSRKTIEENSTGNHRLLQLRDFTVDRKTIFIKNLIKINVARASGDQILQKYDLIFLSKGAKPFAHVISDIPPNTIPANYFFKLNILSDINSEYIAWFLNKEESKLYFSRYSGTTAHMPVIRKDILMNIKIPIPPINIQNKIVKINNMITQEQNLLNDLAIQRRRLGQALCNNLMTNN